MYFKTTTKKLISFAFFSSTADWAFRPTAVRFDRDKTVKTSILILITVSNSAYVELDCDNPCAVVKER